MLLLIKRLRDNLKTKKEKRKIPITHIQSYPQRKMCKDDRKSHKIFLKFGDGDGPNLCRVKK